MKYSSLTTALVALTLVGSGCSIFSSIVNPRSSEADVEAAAAKDDREALLKMAQDKRNDAPVRRAATAAIIADLAKRNDMDGLSLICGEKPPYGALEGRYKACDKKQIMEKEAALKVFRAADCSQVVPTVTEVVRTINNYRGGEARYQEATGNRVEVATRLLECKQTAAAIKHILGADTGKIVQEKLWSKFDLDAVFLAFAKEAPLPWDDKAVTQFVRFHIQAITAANKPLKTSKCQQYQALAEASPDWFFDYFGLYLRTYQCKEAADTVRKRLDSRHWVARKAACMTLAKIGTKKDVSKISKLGFSDEHKSKTAWYPVRAACLDAAAALSVPD